MLSIAGYGNLLIYKYNISYNSIFVAGDSGNDEDMMSGRIKSIVVANHTKELDHLKQSNSVYFSDKSFAYGVMDGMIFYGIIK